MRLRTALESRLATPLSRPDAHRVRGPLPANPHRLARDDGHRQRHDDHRHRPARRIGDRPPDDLPRDAGGGPRHPVCRLHRDPGGPSLPPLEIPTRSRSRRSRSERRSRGRSRLSGRPRPRSRRRRRVTRTRESQPANAAAVTAAVPGGEGAIPDALRTLPTTPILALLAFVTAGALGAGHALTPGTARPSWPRTSSARGDAAPRPGSWRRRSRCRTRSGSSGSRWSSSRRKRRCPGPRRPGGAGRRRTDDPRHRRLDAAHRGAPWVAARRQATSTQHAGHDHAHEHGVHAHDHPDHTHEHARRRAGPGGGRPRAQPRRRPAPPRAGRRVDHHLALAVHPRSRGRPHPVDRTRC